MKTNKSYTKRFKVTKKGKVLARAKGQNHFNAKESGRTGLSKKRTQKVNLSNKVKSRFLPNK
jgi:ribosomal protein L35